MLVHRLSLPAASIVLAYSFVVAPAIADTYILTVKGVGVDATATLFGSPDVSTPGAIDFGSGLGNLNGSPIGLYNPGGTATSWQTVEFTSPPFIYATSWEYDNVGYSNYDSGLVLDEYGLLFESQDDHFNVFSVGSAYGFSDDEIPYGSSLPLTSVTLTVADTPEPAAFVLLSTGLIGMAGTLRRRKASAPYL